MDVVAGMMDTLHSESSGTRRRAAVLTARPPETPEELAALPQVTDQVTRQSRAWSLLRTLQRHARTLRDHLDPGDDHLQRLLHAAYTNDEPEMARLGLDTEYAWLDDILATMINGAPYVEFEAAGPYAARHLDGTGQLRVSAERLSPDEVAGLHLSAVFRDLAAECGNARVVSLLDDVTVPSVHNGLTPEQADQYVVEMARLFAEAGVIRRDDVPGRDYLFIRESHCLRRLDELLARLRRSDEGVVEVRQGTVVFRPSATFVDKLALISKDRKREFRKRGILLARDGVPTCQALDAASFLDPINATIVHVVMLDKRFASEQDKTYALLRAMNIVTQDRYYNVFFDTELLSPPTVAYVVVELMAEHLRRILRTFTLFERWENVDHDRVASVVLAQLRRDGVLERAERRAAPFSILVSPYVASDGSLEMLESHPASRPYLRKTVNLPERNSPWQSFEDQVRHDGGHGLVRPLSTVRRRRAVVNGAAFSLPRETYDVAMSYLVYETPPSRAQLRVMVRALAVSVKAGGILTVVHTAGPAVGTPDVGARGSRAWVNDIEEAYRDADMDVTVHQAGTEAGVARWGDDAVIVVVARKLR